MKITCCWHPVPTCFLFTNFPFPCILLFLFQFHLSSFDMFVFLAYYQSIWMFLFLLNFSQMLHLKWYLSALNTNGRATVHMRHHSVYSACHYRSKMVWLYLLFPTEASYHRQDYMIPRICSMSWQYLFWKGILRNWSSGSRYIMKTTEGNSFVNSKNKRNELVLWLFVSNTEFDYWK